MLVGHVSKEGEDHKARKETGQRVDGAGDDSISKPRNTQKKSKMRMQIYILSVQIHMYGFKSCK